MKYLAFFIFSMAMLLGTQAANAESPIEFDRDIRPILSENCIFCHGPDSEHRKADLRLDMRDGAFGDHDGVTPVKPGDLDGSEIWQRIISDDPDEVMPTPKSKKKLTAKQKALIKQWIESGADWSEHWAFIAPEKPAGDGIDTFIERQLKSVELPFSEPASARTLVRRLHLDLNGLPPTPNEVDTFLAAHKKDATKALGERVDALLATPAFGERMALWWLDAARYGDTSVMHADGPRDMWPWRDWVVDAFNENKPFDTFSIEQLAGDLLPDATVKQKIASGFNRNHATSDEGGAIPEELRVEYVVDRVRTTASVWMGLTMECAQCHDHKYDPISQQEYYEFYAFFNNHTDPGMQSRKGNEAPVIEVMLQSDADVVAAARVKEKAAGEVRKKARQDLADELKTWLKPTANNPEPAGAGLKDLKHVFSTKTIQPTFAAEPISAKTAKIDGMFAQPKKNERSAILLNGKNAITFDSFPNYDFNKTPFTFSAWVNVPKGAGGSIFSDMDVPKKYRGYDMWLQGGAIGSHIINSWPNNAVKVVSAKPLTPNKWHHVVITWNAKQSSDGLNIYIDGEEVEKKVEAKKLTGTTISDAPFRIGARSRGGNSTGKVEDIQIYTRVLNASERALVARNPVEVARAQPDSARSPNEKRLLDETFLTQAEPYQKALAAETAAKAKVDSLVNGKVTSMIMGDNPESKTRMTYILDRGAYDAPKKEESVSAGVPAVLPPLATNAPANRLALATWLFEDEHPLTARVTVNQVWQIFFGRGLVETPGDFGAQGAFPSHPDLLDWLATDFREHGWDMKRLVRQIVTSRTYLQDSRLTDAQVKADPENKMLGRAPRFRLQAELIRDNALALSGLLNPEIGGAGVKPYQPPGLWAEVGLGGNPKFKQDSGDKLYRRSIYTYWKRSAPAPSMQIFDAPTREVCIMQRPRTNTPLQALVTMNDIQFVEASRHLAERMMKQESPLAFGYELVTAQAPNKEVAAELQRLFDKAKAAFEKDNKRATDLLGVGESKRDDSLNAVEHAATTVVASLLLNLDQTLTRE